MTVGASIDLAAVVALEDAASAIATARRAALADRYAANSLSIEWRPLMQLEPVVPQWHELAARALEANVFYEPAFLLAAVPILGRDVGALLIWSGTEPRRLLGFFPARVQSRRYGATLPMLVGLTHPFGPLGVPLVERETAEPVLAAFFAHLAATARLPGLVLLPFLPQAGPFAAVLDTILRRAQMPAAAFNRHQRALLQPGAARSLYVERAISQHRQKELRRQWRRLSETGAALFTATTEPDAIGSALEDFFALEASGWKGRAGTAAAGHEPLRRFIRTAVCGLAAERKVAINRLLIDGRPIAATIVLRSGRSAWFWKIAYDEAFARFSPGVMLSVEVTSELAEDTSLARTDSCAAANHPMIDHLWRERLPLSDRMIAVQPQAPFALARRLEGLRATAIAGARRIRGYLRPK